MKHFCEGAPRLEAGEEVTWPSRVATFAFLVFSLLGVLGCNVGQDILRPGSSSSVGFQRVRASASAGWHRLEARSTARCDAAWEMVGNLSGT